MYFPAEELQAFGMDTVWQNLVAIFIVESDTWNTCYRTVCYRTPIGIISYKCDK